LTALVT
jgi:uracil-DNA glycosylase family 4